MDTELEGLSEEDKRFLIDVTLANRDYLTDISKWAVVVRLGFISAIVAFYSFILTVSELLFTELLSQTVRITIYAALLVAAAAAIVWAWRRTARIEYDNYEHAEKLNEQYQALLRASDVDVPEDFRV